MRTLLIPLIPLILSSLSACGPRDQEPATPEGDWIEVDLPENVYREHPEGYRQETLIVPVAPGEGLELMLAMSEEDAIVYSWEVAGIENPDHFLAEFHGHTERVEPAPGHVVFYRRATGITESGSLIAPFDGIHGWYFRNDSAEPAVVQIRVAGFYEVAPE
jgi:hypothetical protein